MFRESFSVPKAKKKYKGGKFFYKARQLISVCKVASCPVKLGKLCYIRMPVMENRYMAGIPVFLIN